MCGEPAAQHRPRCFWLLPLRNLPSETSEIRKQYCFNFAFSFEFGTQETSVYTTTSLLGQRADHPENNIRGSPLVNLKELLPSQNKNHDAKRVNKRSKVQSKLHPTLTSGKAPSLAWEAAKNYDGQEKDFSCAQNQLAAGAENPWSNTERPFLPGALRVRRVYCSGH